MFLSTKVIIPIVDLFTDIGTGNYSINNTIFARPISILGIDTVTKMQSLEPIEEYKIGI